MSLIKSSPKIDLLATKKAFPYQVEAFMALKDLPYSAVFHEQGLGKTKIAIDLCLYWLSSKDIDSVMIVSKKQLVHNWEEELKFHTHLHPSILNTDRSHNYYVLNSVSKVILSNFETIEFEIERIELFLKCRNVAVIIDESTKLKNPDAKLTQSFFSIADGFKIRTIMTGTPVANRPYDIWAQIYFLDKGASLGSNFVEFKKLTNLSNKLSKNNDLRNIFEESVGGIFKKINKFTVRETKKSCAIELPEKCYEVVPCEFEQVQKSIYNKLLRDNEIEIEKNGETILDNDEECLKKLLRLNQVASNPALVDDSYKNISGKEKKLDELLFEILKRDEKCIVWSSYIDNINFFCSKYKKYGSAKIHGSMLINERNMSVDKFKHDTTCKILFATPQAAKEGLTLTVANNAIFYDRTFNLDDYLQAQDRIHRISQNKKCIIYNLKIQESIDDWIDALLTAKQNAASLAQGDISRKEYIYRADYSYADIIKKLIGGKEPNE